MSSYFSNADITVEREEGDRTAAGFETTSTTTILETRGDAQESGRALERAQQLHEAGDVLFFAEKAVTDVKAGDSVTIDTDDGRTLNGSVEEARNLDRALLIAL